MGKSALMLSMAVNLIFGNGVAWGRVPVFIFSLEVSHLQTAIRVLIAETQVPLKVARQGILSGRV